MGNNLSYTIEEVSKLLKVSKLTVYDLVKKNELSAYRVGRQMRIDHSELEKYKSTNKIGYSSIENSVSLSAKEPKQNQARQIYISGQDFVLDMLSKYIENKMDIAPLRVYNGSLNSLIAMYNGNCDIVSVHLYDGDTGVYNIPFVKRMLVSQPFILFNLVIRNAGFYVAKGNPKNIKTWNDLANPQISMINREIGSGARVLLDEQLRLHKIKANSLTGYDVELTSHYSIASAIANGQADVGIGIESVTKVVNVDFIPLIKEEYDLVILKTDENEELLRIIKEGITSSEFRSQLEHLNGYDLSLTGKIKYES